ncbi:MAG: hypothetical protein JST81_13660 [Bacteroidetes bacterium]|nr:hypothetical protein [Bacteroidota bacterium]
MEKILGLDLGTNSIGWAIRVTDTMLENQIIDKGVLTFEKGVGEGKSGEFPLVQKRTESRHKRRNYQAEKYRKWHLLQCLINHKMCPLSQEELNEWRHYKKGTGRKYPKSQKFIQWLRFDFNGDDKPDFEEFGFSKHESYYLFRLLAVSNEDQHKQIFDANPHILGRILYQLVQRRGFKGRDEEEAQTMMRGSKDGATKGRNDIVPYLEKYNTLGAALYHLQKEQTTRIRKRYNLRSDYEHELKEICKSHNIADDIYKQLWKAIVWQRPLRSQKGLVGICTFEKNKSRCPISHPLYEEYRTWVFINNLKISVPEDVNKATYLKEKIYPLFYNASADFKLSCIYKQLKKDAAISEANFKDDTKVISCRLLNSFEKILGENWKEKYGWAESLTNQIKKCPYSVEDIWHVLFSFDSGEKLKEFAIVKLNLKEEAAEIFSKIKLQQGYATLSLSAIKKILPYLQKGLIYSEAIYLANMPKVFGEKNVSNDLIDSFESVYKNLKKTHDNEKMLNGCVNDLIKDELNSENRYRIETERELDNDEMQKVKEKLRVAIGSKSWNAKTDEEQRQDFEYAATHYKEFLKKPLHGKKDGLFLPVPNLYDRIKKYLAETYNISEKRLSYLWHPSEQEIYPNAKEKPLENGGSIKLLGEPQPISRGFKNPMALKTMHKMKRLVNYLLESNKIDEDTRVVVEIARELNDSNKRKAIEKWQKEREKENEEYKKVIDEINQDCNANFNREDKNLIDRVRLWKEQNMYCLYTGKMISQNELFNGIKYDIEHTIPASMSFDNELKNLTIAGSVYNREIKKKNIPFDCPNYWEEVTIDGITYNPIIKNLEMVFGKRTVTKKKIRGKEIEIVSYEKIEHLEHLYDEWKKKTSDKKEIKDAIIQRRHLIKMELDYWRKKLDTFIIKEYKAGWRNSQMRDTQIITKYALPYLKTVFRKTEVQKGNITSDFRKIYKIQGKTEKKDRRTHTHHAIDAAVLTLIPPAATRDKILQAYNEEIDKKTGFIYHENPRGWKNFSAAHILSIAKDVLINFQPQHRTLTPTYKNVRKRGKQQFVKYKDSNGKWHYKLDDAGNRIHLVAKGDSIRGQLHKESFFGAIKKNKELLLVERYPIAAFTSINDCKNIVDDAVRKIVQDELDRRIKKGESFDKAKLEPIPFNNGTIVIKKVRCKVAAGRGVLTPEKALSVHKHSYVSKHDYKQTTYAQNEENIVCLYYELKTEYKIERAFRIIGLFELAQLRLKNIEAIKFDKAYNKVETGKGNNKKDLPIAYLLRTGTKVIFYKEHLEELKEMSKEEILRRLYLIFKFNDIGSTKYIYMQHHNEARPDKDLSDGYKEVELEKYQDRIRLTADKFTFAIEGKDFEVKTDGQIKFIF